MLCRLALTMTLIPLAIADLFVGQADCFVEGKNPSRFTIIFPFEQLLRYGVARCQ